MTPLELVGAGLFLLGASIVVALAFAAGFRVMERWGPLWGMVVVAAALCVELCAVAATLHLLGAPWR